MEKLNVIKCHSCGVKYSIEQFSLLRLHSYDHSWSTATIETRHCVACASTVSRMVILKKGPSHE